MIVAGRKSFTMPDDLQPRVEDWLKLQGYPLEMRTAQTFQQRGWFLHHSRRYKDPILGKEREIDILAFNDDADINSPIHAHFVIECKWTPGKPWVLFTSVWQTLTPLGHFRSTPMTTYATQATEGLISQDIVDLPLFSGLKEGYAIVQAFSKDAAVDAAYSALQASVNAADFFAKQMSEEAEHSIIYIPTLVLDGDLFRCSLTKDGDVTVQQVDIGCLIHHTADGSRCIHIVRESALRKFIDLAEATCESLRSTLRKRRISSQNTPIT
jgi:hypothetical protein